MPAYALGLMPLLSSINPEQNMNQYFKQIAYADDITGIVKLDKLRRW